MSIIPFILFLPGLIIFYKIVRDILKKHRDKVLTFQFKELISIISTLLSTGYSMENACLEAQKEMELLYGTEAYMYQEMAEINRSQKMSVALEKSIEEFGFKVPYIVADDLTEDQVISHNFP